MKSLQVKRKRYTPKERELFSEWGGREREEVEGESMESVLLGTFIFGFDHRPKST